MKQTIEIEIEVPDGKKAILKDNKVVFEDIKPKLPENWEEFCKLYRIKENEYYIEPNSTITSAACSYRSDRSDRNLLPSLEAAEQHLALMQLHQLRDCYRQGWKPDFLDNSRKWCILNNKNILSIDFILNCSTFLSFQTKELAEQFLNNFRDLIEQAGDLI